MKVPTFLMAMVLLVGAAPHRSPLFNLHVILSEVEKLNQSHPQVRDAGPPAGHAIASQTLNCLSFSGLLCGRPEGAG